MSYLLPSGESNLNGACAFDDGVCAWSGRAAYRWDPGEGWTSFSDAPAPIDSGFELKSGVLAGADTHVGFLPRDGSDWAGWADLSSFSDAHPMYGDLLLGTDRHTDTYTLFEISTSGLNPRSQFDADELAEPLAGWSSPTNPDRVLLLGDDGLWALDPPYTSESLQHLVSFDGVELPPLADIPGPFQPGFATVAIPRRTRTALRLDLSDGTGDATGLKHVPGSAALWTAYLHDNRTAAHRLLSTLASLPSPSSDSSLHLHDALMDEEAVCGIATSAGLWSSSDAESAGRPERPKEAATLQNAPLDQPALTTWALWLGWDGARDTACRQLCNASDPDVALAESLRIFAGRDACTTLFDLLQSASPPMGPDGEYGYPRPALRALVAPFGPAVAAPVSSALSASSIPARVAACAAAGATRADLNPAPANEMADPPEETDPVPTLWDEEHPIPEAALRANVTHDHPAVQAAAREACARLSIEDTPSPTTL